MCTWTCQCIYQGSLLVCRGDSMHHNNVMISLAISAPSVRLLSHKLAIHQPVYKQQPSYPIDRNSMKQRNNSKPLVETAIPKIATSGMDLLDVPAIIQGLNPWGLPSNSSNSHRPLPCSSVPRHVVGPESSIGVWGTKGDHAAHDDAGIAGICGQISITDVWWHGESTGNSWE